MGARGWLFWCLAAALASVMLSSPAFGRSAVVADATTASGGGTAPSLALRGAATFVAPGQLVSTADIVDGCRTITVQRGRVEVPGRVVARDASTDLVLIAADLSPLRAARLGPEPEIGATITGFGFPPYRLLSVTGSFATGRVLSTPTRAAAAGTIDHFLPFMAPLWTDTLGGPTLDQNGNIVGIVADGYDPELPGRAFKHIALAVASRFVADFARGAGVTVTPGSIGERLDPTEIAEIAKGLTVRVLCDE